MDKCDWDGDCDNNQVRQKNGVERKRFLGIKGEGLMQRSVKHCLSCKKAECDGCPTRAERARTKGGRDGKT